MPYDHRPQVHGNQPGTPNRQMTMNRFTFIGLLMLIFVIACGGSSSTTTALSEADSAELMATAVLHLVSENHTFGDGPPPFSEYLIEESTLDIDGANRRLTEEERVAVEDAISQFGPVRWVTDPDEWRTDGLEPSIEGSVILGVGVPYLDGETVLVPVSLWCGGTCGTWFTYQLQDGDGGWQVTGIDGPISIS